MTTNRTPINRKRWNYLTLEDDDRPVSIERWRRYREQIMQYEAVWGKRPEEWWLYDHGVAQPEHQGAALYEMGNELRPDELEYLLEFWRKHFELAMSPNFSIPHAVNDPDRPEHHPGIAAKRSHLEWAGIPHTLLTQWHAERKRADVGSSRYNGPHNCARPSPKLTQRRSGGLLDDFIRECEHRGRDVEATACDPSKSCHKKHLAWQTRLGLRGTCV
jgi:hypothetical protein